MNSIEETCFWLATRSVERNDKNTLQGNSNADIVIIGAGFTGLWTALFLKQLEPAKDVLVVEQGVAGYGGSGRNAGIVGVGGAARDVGCLRGKIGHAVEQ